MIECVQSTQMRAAGTQNINSRSLRFTTLFAHENFWARTRWVQQIPIIFTFANLPVTCEFVYFFETANGLWPKKGDTISPFQSICFMSDASFLLEPLYFWCPTNDPILHPHGGALLPTASLAPALAPQRDQFPNR